MCFALVLTCVSLGKNLGRRPESGLTVLGTAVREKELRVTISNNK